MSEHTVSQGDTNQTFSGNVPVNHQRIEEQKFQVNDDYLPALQKVLDTNQESLKVEKLSNFTIKIIRDGLKCFENTDLEPSDAQEY